MKNFFVMKDLDEKQVISDSFVDLVEQAFTTAQPLIQFMERAVSFEE